MASNKIRNAFASLRAAAPTKPAARQETEEQARARFNRRLATIRGTAEAKEIKHYRNKLMRRKWSPDGGLGIVTARRERGDAYTQFPDQFRKLNERLDMLGVAPCFA